MKQGSVDLFSPLHSHIEVALQTDVKPDVALRINRGAWHRVRVTSNHLSEKLRLLFLDDVDTVFLAFGNDTIAYIALANVVCSIGV